MATMCAMDDGTNRSKLSLPSCTTYLILTPNNSFHLLFNGIQNGTQNPITSFPSTPICDKENRIDCYNQSSLEDIHKL